MKKFFSLIILLAALISYGLGNELDHASKMAASQELFSNEIRGILIDRCVKCHGGKKTRSGFNLITRKGLLSGGDQGAAVIVGEPDKSPIIKYLRHTEEPFMPPKESILPEASISKIEKWKTWTWSLAPHIHASVRVLVKSIPSDFEGNRSNIKVVTSIQTKPRYKSGV